MLLIVVFLSVSEKKDSIRVIITIVNIKAIISVSGSVIFSYLSYFHLPDLLTLWLAIQLHAFLFTSVY